MRGLILALLLLMATPILAQNNNQSCGNGLPCGSLPWPLPTFPAMPSPTPIAIDDSFANPPPVPTSTAMATLVDLAPIENGIGTMEAALNATPISIEIEGTLVSPEDIVLTYVGDGGGIFGYIKGLNSNSLGILAPFVNFVIIALLVVMVTQLNTFIIPIAMAVFGMIRKVLSLILDFLPF
jgi:hypothetical protein